MTKTFSAYKKITIDVKNYMSRNFVNLTRLCFVFDIVQSGVNWYLAGKCYLDFSAVYCCETSVIAPNTVGYHKL